MKKILAGILILVMIVGLVGCSSAPTQDEENILQTTEETNI